MYVATKGGERAIENAHAWLAEERRGDPSVPELSVAQIAARTGKSPKAVESLLSRAREQFRRLLRWYFSDTKCRNDA